MILKYKSHKANLREADNFIKIGEKLYWLPHVLIIGYFFSLESIENFNLGLFFIFAGIFIISIYIGIAMTNKGFQIIDYIHSENKIK